MVYYFAFGEKRSERELRNMLQASAESNGYENYTEDDFQAFIAQFPKN
jgi:hypothetical protein